MANTSRDTATLAGEDNLTATGNTINQRLLIFGRPVIQKTAGSITKQDDWAIKRRGEIELEFNSKWIQSKDEAESLAQWLVNSWARNDMEYTIEIFGNPLIELTDVISLQFGDMVPSEDKFFVVSSSSNFDRGVRTTLKLRRV